MNLRISGIAAAIALASASLALSTPASAADATSGASVKKAQGTAKADAITGATKKRESRSGAIRLTETAEGQKLLREMVLDFIWTGDTVFDGHRIRGGR